MSRTSQSLRPRFATRTLSPRSRKAIAAAAAGVSALLALPEAASAALTHRYSFNAEGATQATDSVGTANGQLVNGAAVTGGQLILGNTGTSNDVLTGQYVDLPNDIAKTSSFTIEGWATWNGGNDWQRFFDFGTNDQGERVPGQAGGHTGTSYYYVTPRTGNDPGNNRLLNFGAEVAVNQNGQFANARDAGGNAFAYPVGSEHYFALTRDAATNTLSLYMDGQLVGQNTNATHDPSTITMHNVWLGRSNWQGDAFYAGSINEFRIWDNALTASSIAQNFAVGPDALPAGIQWIAANGAWNVGSNWSSGAEPTGASTAVIGNGGVSNVTTTASTIATRITNGTLNVNAGGDLTSNIELVPGNAPASATLNINGGTLRAGSITAAGEGVGNGAKAVNINGGTLVSTASFTLNGNNLTSSVGPNGATVDTQFGTTVTWAVPLTPAGVTSVLNKVGPGTLLLSGGGYAAPVAVRGGVLAAAGDVGAAGAPSQIGDAGANGGDVATLRITAPATVSGPITVGTAAGSGTYALRSTAAGAVNVTGPITLNQSVTIGNTGTGVTDTTNVLTLSGGIANANAGPVDVIFDNNGTVNVQGVGISEASTGAASLVKNGTGTLNLLAPNGYAGTTTINNGVVHFKAPNTIPGTGATVTVNSNIDPANLAFGVAAAGDGFVPGTLATTFFPRLVSTSTGAAALTASTSENFNFSDTGPGALNMPSLSLGAHGGDVTYTGTITPAGGVYRLGGGGGNLILSNANAVTGAGNSLIVSGPGGMVTPANSNDYGGGTTVTLGGTLSISNPNQIGTGQLTLGSGGTLRATGTTPLVYAQPVNLDVGNTGFRVDNTSPTGLRLTGGVNSLNNDVYQVAKTGPGMLTLGGGTVDAPVSHQFGNRALLIREGGVTATDAGQVNVGQWLSVGQEGNQRGTLIVEKDATLTVGTDLNVSDVGNSRGTMIIRDNAVVSANAVFVGKNSTTQGALLQTGGQLIDRAGGPESRIGGTNANAAQSVGTYTMTGGTFTANNNLQPGAFGRGALTQTGGTVTVGEWYASGRFAGSYGVHTVGGTGAAGGTFNQTNTNTRLIVGELGTGILNVADGGNVTAASGINLGHGGSGVGILNLLPGGTVTTPNVARPAGQGTVNFHGGVLRPAVSTAGLMSGLTAAYSWSDGGAIVDTDGKDVTIAQPITAPTGQGVSNIAVATPGAAYVAHPVVEITGGGGTGATAVPVLGPTGEVTGIRVTNPGVNYTSAPTVRILGGGSATEATLGNVTLANNAGGGLTKVGAGTLTLSGANTYTGATTIAAGTLKLPTRAPVVGLTHRYDFNTEADTQATDVVGGAHGQLVRGASISGGKLILNNTGTSNLVDSGQYVDLPNNIARTSSFTVEGWTNWGGGNAWQRVFDFGTTNANPATNPGGEILPDDTLTAGYNGTDYYFLAPSNGTNAVGELNVATQDFVNAPGPLPSDDSEHHFAMTRDAGTSTMRLYIDGVLVATDNAAPNDPAVINMVNAWLGRSNYFADAFYNGDINEFRIFDVALTDASVAANFAAGPNGQIATAGMAPPGEVAYLPAGTAMNIINAGAAFDLANQNSRIGSLAGVTGSSVTLGSGTLTIGGDATAGNFAGVISGTGGLVKMGTGTQTLSGANTYTGATTVNGGTLLVTGSVAPSWGVTVNDGGTFEAGATQTLSALTINPGGTGRIVAGGNRVLKTGNLAITGTGKLDVTNNDLIVTNTPATAVRDLIRSGYGTGTWNGTGGILTSLPTPAPGKTAGLGWAQGNDPNLSLGGQLGGVSFAPTDTVVKYTYFGDADLDGDADGNDVAKWGLNFTGDLAPGTGTKTWTQGDWDYDGDVDGNDAARWGLNFTGDLGGNGLSVDVPVAIGGEALATLEGLGFTVNVVPEPATLSLIMAAGLLARRRRR